MTLHHEIECYIYCSEWLGAVNKISTKVPLIVFTIFLTKNFTSVKWHTYKVAHNLDLTNLDNYII